MDALVATFEANGNVVELDADTVRNYLTSGNGKVTDQEVAMFINLCKYQGLNPFVREAYLIKYDDTKPANIVVGKDAFTRRAAQIPEFHGWTAGVAVVAQNGEYQEREGTIVLPGEKLVGGWCAVDREGWQKPFKATVNLGEYNTGKSMWVKMPATMIRKVAIVQALREAFPDKFQGMYDQSEMGTDEQLPEIEIPQNTTQMPINAAKKKALTEMLENDREKILIAQNVISSYGYTSCKDILNCDFDDIVLDLKRAFEDNEMITFDNLQDAEEING